MNFVMVLFPVLRHLVLAVVASVSFTMVVDAMEWSDKDSCSFRLPPLRQPEVTPKQGSAETGTFEGNYTKPSRPLPGLTWRTSLVQLRALSKGRQGDCGLMAVILR